MQHFPLSFKRKKKKKQLKTTSQSSLKTQTSEVLSRAFLNMVYSERLERIEVVLFFLISIIADIWISLTCTINIILQFIMISKITCTLIITTTFILIDLSCFAGTSSDSVKVTKMSTPEQGTELWFSESQAYTFITRTTFLPYMFAFTCTTEERPRHLYSSFAQSQDDKVLF